MPGQARGKYRSLPIIPQYKSHESRAMLLEFKNIILEMIARGVSLETTIERICLEMEARVPGILCVITTVKGGPPCDLTCPLSGINGLTAIIDRDLEERLVSCPPSALVQEASTKAENQELAWIDLMDFVPPVGFKSCWPAPVLSGNRLVAMVKFYHWENRDPTDLEQEAANASVHLCLIAIERHERVLERQRLAYTDSLTGLPNRARFNEFLKEKSMQENRISGILLADIDNLKLVNDTFGHAAGDALIQLVGSRISAIMTAENTFRLGGDEFAIVISGEAPIDLAAKAHKILVAIKPPAECGGHVIFPAVTLGGAYREHESDLSQLRQNADIALYHAKERSRGQYVEFHPDLGTALTRRTRDIRDVSVALVEDRIDVHYQPIIRLDTREIVGFEALCRMTTASGQITAAANFHEATKDAHVAAELTERMLLRVAQDVRNWLDRGLPFQHVGINLSAADFQNGNLEQRLCTVFANAGVPLKHIVLEVTESVYLSQRDYAIAEEIKGLRTKGMRVALDDFGTGFASLTHLLTVPVDIIKIDKSFVHRMVPGDSATFIIEGLVAIAKNLGIGVVAEGIETSSQAEQLVAMGCELGQGFLYSKAVNRTAAGALIESPGHK